MRLSFLNLSSVIMAAILCNHGCSVDSPHTGTGQTSQSLIDVGDGCGGGGGYEDEPGGSGPDCGGGSDGDTGDGSGASDPGPGPTQSGPDQVLQQQQTILVEAGFWLNQTYTAGGVLQLEYMKMVCNGDRPTFYFVTVASGQPPMVTVVSSPDQRCA